MSNTVNCPICGKTEFREKYDNDICDFCGWENDCYWEAGGANILSLAEFRERYQIYMYLNPNYTWKTNGHPELTIKELCTYWHQYSIANKQNVLASNRCGCFFCQKIFDSRLVSEHYINDKNGETAICPFCGVDALLPDNKVHLSTNLLADMYQVCFNEPYLKTERGIIFERKNDQTIFCTAMEM